MTLNIILSTLFAYIFCGIYYGWKHSKVIVKRIQEAGHQEEYLRRMVALYEFSPKGAEYYTELQELYITESESLTEYFEFENHPTKYRFIVFLLGSLLWPYYLYLTSRK